MKRTSSLLLAGICMGMASGAGAMNCTFGFSAKPLAILLPVSSATPQRVEVGSILQNCSGNGNYTLVIGSGNCLLYSAGAKLTGQTTTEFVGYSVEFDNPTTGGSQAVVTGLLANYCWNADGRQVNNAKITNESSSVYINFTGSTVLPADTYTDTLIVTLNMD